MSTRSRLPVNEFSRKGPLRGAVTRFIRDEDGNLIILGVYTCVLMLMLTGIGIDLMRFERDRSALQYTLDRAVLAAADLEQTKDAKAVVDDYMAKAGLDHITTKVTPKEGLGFRRVTAEAESSVRTQFMHMTGVDTLKGPASSTAEESIGGIEISLVLDVSGSMNYNNRLTNLKIAAKDFIDTMSANTEEGKLSLSIVPYATQVSLPGYLLDEMTVTDEHDYSHCINFEASDFDVPSLSLTETYKRTLHFDPWQSYDGRTADPQRLVRRPVCEDAGHRQTVVMQNDKTALKAFIDSFDAEGNTSIDVGMKWGVALLDPSIQPAIENLATAEKVPDIFSDRPAEYTDPTTLKVVVLMTDGQNTNQYYIKDGFRDAQSNVWWNDAEEAYSVNIGADVNDRDGDGDRSEDIYYRHKDGSWADYPYGNGSTEGAVYETVCVAYFWFWCIREETRLVSTTSADEPGTAVRLSYADLWARTTLNYVDKELLDSIPGYSNSMSNWYSSVGGAKDTRTKAICDAAKEKNILVYTIAFEAPSAGKNLLKACASSDSHYFDVKNLEIADAFSAIASSIRLLRLTQ